MTLQELRAAVRSALDRMEAASRALDELPDDATDDQITEAQRAFDEATEEHRGRAEALERREAIDEARRRAPAAPADDNPGGDPEGRDGGASVTREPLTYERGNGQSYFLDLARVQVNGDAGARSRLQRHGEEVGEEVERREQRRRAALERGLDQLLDEADEPLARALRAAGVLDSLVDRRGRVEQRDLTRTDGSGGHFVPPLHLLDEYAELARGGRPFADACRGIPLPGGTDSINIPRITTGTATAAQTADNAAVNEQDIVDAVVTAPVRTIAGQQDLALQLLEQSPVAFDEVVFSDLIADYHFRVNDQAINGSGAAGQVLGIRNVVGINAVTYTDASPTVPELYPKIADALSQARAARKRPITHGWIAPRRYYWATAALDANNRPFVVPQYAGPQNAPGVFDPTVGEDVPVRLHGVPHAMDDAIPLTLGAGTNEDLIILSRMLDHILFEGDLRARALMEVLSGTLQVRLQVYAYVAFTAGRFPAATSTVAGTGLVAPTF